MNLEGQAAGLAAVLQAARLVQDLAQDGRCADAPAAVLVESVFRIDAETALAIYGGPEGLALGIGLLERVLANRHGNPGLTRIAINVLGLERSLAREPARLAALGEGIAAARRSRDALGASSDALHERLAELYVQNLSVLKPRVLVQGNGAVLSQPRVVARIRTLLLAAVRGAVLWRQMGGTRLRLLLGRRRLAEACARLAAALPGPRPAA